MKKQNFFLSIALLIIAIFILNAHQSLAQSSIINSENLKYKQGTYDADDILGIAIHTSKLILGITGSLTLLMFVYGGISFLIAAGSSEKVTKAKGIITAAVVGLIIVFSSYLIIKFALSALGRDDFDGSQMKIKSSSIPSTVLEKQIIIS